MLDNILETILKNGYLTSGTALVLVIYTLAKIWKKYEDYLKITVNTGVKDNQKTLNEIKELISNTIISINEINQNIDDFQKQINLLEEKTSNTMTNVKSNYESLSSLSTEIEIIKQNLENLKYTIIMVNKH